MQRKATEMEENGSFALVETGQDFFLYYQVINMKTFFTVSLEVKGKGEGSIINQLCNCKFIKIILVVPIFQCHS